MKVIIAEKPSVAKNIADALHIKTRKDGYFDGQDYLITWAFGHLLELYDAKDYDEKMGLWRMEYFPFVPEGFKYKVKLDATRKKTDAGAKKQLKCIKDLIAKTEVDGVISATDYDREGQIIGDTILQYLKVKKPIYRMLLNEWTEDEVKKGLESLVSNETMKPLQDAGISRQHADWLIGINLTSVATLKYKAQKGEVFNIGRVLLPTLKMIYDRDKEIAAFNPEPYYKLTGHFNFSGGIFDGTYTLDKKDKFENQEALEKIRVQSEGATALLADKETIEKNEYPQPLFNLSALQGYITSKYSNFTADKVLKVAQSLYESKYITYPRTASSVLDESLVGKTKKVLETVKKGLPYEADVQFKVTPRVFNSKKVESHSAIMPTYVIPKTLGHDEQVVYQAIKNRFVMQFMPAAQVEETTLTATIEGVEGAFIAKGKVQKVLGWKKVENDQGKDTILPDIPKLAEGICETLDVTSHATTPPKPYTEKTLLRAMETCGKQFKEDKEDNDKEEQGENELMDAILSGFSIGTPATRAETLKKLCYTGYVMRQKKNMRCTDKGRQLIEALPIKELMDLEYTGRLEKTLSDMEKGEVAKSEFLNHIIQFVVGGVQNIKTQRQAPIVVQKDVPMVPGTGARQPSKQATKQGAAKSAGGAREVLGKCPLCGADVVEGSKGYGCMGFKSGCTYVIWKDADALKKYGKKPTKTMVKGILKKGEAVVKSLKTPKGTVFDAKVSYAYEPTTKEGKWDFKPV
ncbi:MAG: DNA topoisomerase [Cellulosilyticaceae bacterium]